ncbi:MAG: hypothetical protein A3B23_02155 [Candidatus Colwellbacteria bacterium RIFCSPLOWO2_01_FULL_48_10]|uniref:Uncharacterized protein n=1 Tax=Candidatus Colwellbacteria bacterium RIFCSPLOWO2_01_FULL_48_10 TaxID=1797690 RepID=A0A1G1Z5L1_9BACT|nr:MAG: hypothetical protein A3B23_02155 [Candidatus Colwellbacteria bacterium RIFCSPLOWO2_01_FULL_48_10]
MKNKSVAEEVFEKIEKEQAQWAAMSDIERDQVVRYKVNQSLILQKEKAEAEQIERKRNEKHPVVTFVESHKILAPIIFWGLWVLLLWWLMVRSDVKPDYDFPSENYESVDSYGF